MFGVFAKLMLSVSEGRSRKDPQSRNDSPEVSVAPFHSLVSKLEKDTDKSQLSTTLLCLLVLA